MFELTLSPNSPLNTTILGPDDKPLYVISTRAGFWGRRTTYISYPAEAAQQARPVQAVQDQGEDMLRPEEFARIHWHSTRSSRLIFKGQIKDFSQVLPPVSDSLTWS